VALVGAYAGCVSPAIAQSGFAYVVEDLGTLRGDDSSVAWGINAQGHVVGWSSGPNGTRAFVHGRSGSRMVALPSLPGRPRSVARDISDKGVVVGSANQGGTDLGHAVVWSQGTVRDLGTLGTGSFSEAWGVNNNGQVVGWSYTNGGSGLSGVHAFLCSDADGMVDLTPDNDNGYALDINDAEQVTGYRTAVGGYHAFRWSDGTFEDLGVLPGFAHSFGWAISRTGQVVGSSSTASGNSERFARSTDSGEMESLGGTGEHNVARGVNASGQVVGVRGQSLQRGVIYTDEAGLRDLNALIDPSSGWVVLAANDVNDAGEIAGYGFNNVTGRSHAIVLRPTAPSSGPLDESIDR
jgi:probable HAF family extracellular repeat protein